MKSWQKRTKILFIIFALLWILLLYAGFYRVQKPFGAEHLLAWLRTLWQMLAAATIIVLGSALGRRLLAKIGCDRRPALERLLFAAALGLGLCSLIVMGIGVIGGLRRWLFYLLTCAGLILLRRDVRAVVDDLRAAVRQVVLPRPLAFFYLLALALTLTLALTPPAAWDALQYHLDGPRLYIRQQRITALDNFSLAYSGLLESLFMWAMLLAGDAAAQLVHWAYGVMLLGALYLGGQKMLGSKHAWLPAAALGSMPMFFTLLPWAYNDLGLAFYQLAAFLALCIWREKRQTRWLVLCGLLGGLGLGFKYTAITVLFALALLIPFWQPWKRGNWLTSWAVLGLSAALVAAPWLARNWALWGNPIYPYLFNGLYWDDLRTTWYQRIGSGIGWNWRELLLLPWTASLTLMDVSFREARTGPFFVVMLPLTLIALLWRRRPQERSDAGMAGAALAVSGVQYALWSYGVIQSRSVFQARLLLPTLALFCLPVAAALERLRRLDFPQLSLRRFLSIVLALTLALNAVDLTLSWAQENPLPYLAGVESRADNLTRRLGVYYTTMQDINALLSPQDKILFLWETKGYYCDIPNQPDLIIDRLRYLTALEGDAGHVWQRLRRESYTHVLVFETGLEYLIDLAQNPETEFVFERELAVLQELRAQYLTNVYQNDHYTLYHVKTMSGG